MTTNAYQRYDDRIASAQPAAAAFAATLTVGQRVKLAVYRGGVYNYTSTMIGSQLRHVVATVVQADAQLIVFAFGGDMQVVSTKEPLAFPVDGLAPLEA